MSELEPSSLAPGLLLGADVSLGPDAALGGNVVIHAGVRVGPGARIGDHAQIREGARIGATTTVGSFVSIDPEVSIGDRVSIQARCYLTRGTVVEDDVFIGPGVTTTNDNTMGRHLPGDALRGAALRRACRIGGGVVICPGVEIGAEAFVAAGAVVTKNVTPRAVVAGVPARFVRRVGDAELIERWR